MLQHPIYELIPISTVDAAIDALPANSAVSVTCSPVKGLQATFDLTQRVAALGHRPVPHISARLVASEADVASIAEWCRSLELDTLFVIGGDAERPVGPFDSGLGFLKSFLKYDHGCTTVGIPGYPDGHALISPSAIQSALRDKASLIEASGLQTFVSTQMCFDPKLISSWLTAERSAGMSSPVHLGVPGAIDRAKLITMGARLGIGASLRFLKKNRSTLRQLVSPSSFDPLELVEPLQSQAAELGITGIHLFTFNQVASTREWLTSAQRQLAGTTSAQAEPMAG